MRAIAYCILSRVAGLDAIRTIIINCCISYESDISNYLTVYTVTVFCGAKKE